MLFGGFHPLAGAALQIMAWRPSVMWWCLAAGLAAFTVSDSVGGVTAAAFTADVASRSATGAVA